MLCDKLLVEGILPERAILRVKRAGIDVYNAKKIRKNAIVFSVKKKDTEKVFAIYPNVCYNKESESEYLLTRAGAERTTKLLDFFKKRAGILFGALLFLVLTQFFSAYVLQVEIRGTNIYEREILRTLEKHGVKTLARYSAKNNDLICSEILSLDGVGFCSVKKSGSTLKVEVRMNPFRKPFVQKGGLCAKRSGEILSLSVLRGTPLKKAGDKVSAGEMIVGDYLLTGAEQTEKTQVDTIARLELACSYEETFAVKTEEEAFAQAYLALSLSENGRIREKSIQKNQDGFHVKINYTEIQTINF